MGRRGTWLAVATVAIVVGSIGFLLQGSHSATPPLASPTTSSPATGSGTGSSPNQAGGATGATAGGAVAQLPGPNGSGSIALGVYVKPIPGGDQTASLGQFLASINHRLAIVQTFTGWETPTGTPISFPLAFAQYATSTGATPMITWQPEQGINAQSTPGGVLSDQPNFSLDQIASGRYDSYITSWANQAQSFGHVVYVRPMHEMNDMTYPWSIGVNGNTSATQYITAWRHIVGIFQAQGATNVKFVWCVGARPVAPNPTAYFPGDSYVSWISIDGYNRGKPWNSVTSVFSSAYSEITSVSTHPVMIAETASVEDPNSPGAKAAWITSSFLNEIPSQFPRVKAVLYFSAPGRNFTYALSSSTAALNAFAAVAASPGYQATVH